MDINLSTTDGVVLPLDKELVDSVCHEWEFFACLASGRWSEKTISLPFSADQLHPFLCLVRGQLPLYDRELESVCQYFSPKDDSWLLSVVLPLDTPLDVFRRVGMLSCVGDGCTCVSGDRYSHYCGSASRKPVDIHVITGILARVGYWGPSSEQREAKYSALVRACRELGDDYYEAYFSLMGYAAGVKTLATYSRVKTLLHYHYHDASDTKMVEGTELPVWTSPEIAMHPRLGIAVHVDTPLYQLALPLRQAIVSSLEDLLKRDGQNNNITNWLVAYDSYCSLREDLLS